MSNPYETVTLVAVAQYRKGYAEGLDAARAAVDACQIRTDSGEVLTGGTWDHALLRALAAIDALRDQT